MSKNAIQSLWALMRSHASGKQQPESPKQSSIEVYEGKMKQLKALFREIVHVTNDSSPRQSLEVVLDVQTLDKLRALMGPMLKMIVDESKDFQTTGGSHDALQPCYEQMMKGGLVSELREAFQSIKVREIQVLVLHHLSDLILFAHKPLGHYKHVIEPVLELLRDLESAFEMWPPCEQEPADPATAAISHACIQLVYSLSWQLTHTVHCATFFFVDERSLEFDEKRGEGGPTPSAEERKQKEVFILFEFAIPYLRRVESLRAGEVLVTADDLRGDKAAEMRRLHTSDVAIDALICMLSLPAQRVVRYLERKAELFAVLVADNVDSLCRRLLNDEGMQDTAEERWAANAERLQQRLRLLQAVGCHPAEKLRRSVASEYHQRVLKHVATLLHTRTNPVAAVRLSTVLVKEVPAAMLNEPLVDLLLGGCTGAEELGLGRSDVSVSLRRDILSSDEDLAAAALDLFAMLLQKQPQRAAERLVFPALKAVRFPKEYAALQPIQHAVDALFHPEIRATLGDQSPRRGRMMEKQAAHDAMAAVVRMGTAIQRERPACVPSASHLSSLPALDVPDDVLNPEEASPGTPGLETSLRRTGSLRREGEDALPSIVSKLAIQFLDSPLNLQVAFVNLVTTMLLLNCKELTWLLLVVNDDKMLSFPLMLRNLYTLIAGKREGMGMTQFSSLAAAARARLGVHSQTESGPPPLYDHASLPPDEERFFCGAVLLEEWRREIQAVLMAQRLYREVSRVQMQSDAQAPARFAGTVGRSHQDPASPVTPVQLQEQRAAGVQQIRRTSAGPRSQPARSRGQSGVAAPRSAG